MSSVCDINQIYNLGKFDGLPKSCTKGETEAILLKALESPNPAQRHAAVKRLADFELEGELKTRFLAAFKKEEDQAVLAAMVELIQEKKLKEAIPYLLNKFDNPAGWQTLVAALNGLVDASCLLILEDLFHDYPSRILAQLLLKAGDPYPYLNNFAADDLKMLSDPNSFMQYTTPLWWMYLGGPVVFSIVFTEDLPSPGSSSGPSLDPGAPPEKSFQAGGMTFHTIDIPTLASELKTKIKKNLAVMLDLLDSYKDSNTIPFLFALLKDPANPFPPSYLEKIFYDVVTLKDLPLLLEEIKQGDKKCVSLILNYLLPFTKLEGLTTSLREEIFFAVHTLINEEEFKNKAIKFLAEAGAQSLVPDLLELIKDQEYCALEIDSLAKLQSYPGQYEAIFRGVLGDENKDESSKLAAACALALQGDRSGLTLMIEKLFDYARGLTGGSLPDKINELVFYLSKILRPEDAPQFEIFLNSSTPLAILTGLDLLRSIGGPEALPLVLSVLDDENLTPDPLVLLKKDEKQLIKIEIRLQALLTLIVIREKDDQASLKALKDELEFWQDYVESQESSMLAIAKVVTSHYWLPPPLGLLPEAITGADDKQNEVLDKIKLAISDLENIIKECESE